MPRFDGEELEESDLERVLFCFAVEQEAKFFPQPGMEELITGIGRENAERSLHQALRKTLPTRFKLRLRRRPQPLSHDRYRCFLHGRRCWSHRPPAQRGRVSREVHCHDRVAITVQESAACGSHRRGRG